jgi:hypothetical protein
MSITYYPDQPPPDIDLAEVRPTVDEVAALEQTRTIDSDGNDLGTFVDGDPFTRPTATQCEALIDLAIETVLPRGPVQPIFYPQIRMAATLQTAILIESSYYREQEAGSTVGLYQGLLAKVLTTIPEPGMAPPTTRRVDSPILRGTATDYDPWQPLTPPRIVQEPPDITP